MANKRVARRTEDKEAREGEKARRQKEAKEPGKGPGRPVGSGKKTLIPEEDNKRQRSSREHGTGGVDIPRRNNIIEFATRSLRRPMP